MFTQRRPTTPQRSGTTTVETAIVLPVFLLLLFAIVEFGHAQLVNNMLNKACRNAARIGAVEGTTTADVYAKINSIMSPVVATEDVHAFVNDASVFDDGSDPPTSGEEVESLSPIEVSEAEPRQMFVVRARVAYNDIALVPVPFLTSVVLDSQAFMRHE